MRINNLNNQISFKKSLAATCSVVTDDKKTQDCNIFLLGDKEDKGYFVSLKNKEEWADNKYMSIVNQSLLSQNPPQNIRIYAMEDKDGDCLGYISIKGQKDKEDVEYLETCPSYSNSNKKRKLKYIGQSLMAFVVGQAAKENKAKVYVPNPSANARLFYYWKCGFRDKQLGESGLGLEKRNFSKFLDIYKGNTGKEITFIG